MTKRESIHKELTALYKEGTGLAVSFQKNEEKQFHYDYQRWYTKALKAVASLAPDRHAEFRSYYEIDPKRKLLGHLFIRNRSFFPSGKTGRLLVSKMHIVSSSIAKSSATSSRVVNATSNLGRVLVAVKICVSL